jgi:hypothetical protein
MKKTFITFILLLICFFAVPTNKTYASGIPVMDPVLIGKAVVQFGVENMTKIQSTLTQVNTYKTMWDQTIARPLKDAMTLISIVNGSKQIKNMGSKLVIPNPEQFVRNKAIDSIQTSYDTVEENGGYYSDSFLKSITDSTRSSANTDIKTSLNSLSQSSLPNDLQDNICTDEHIALRAEEEATQGGTIPYDENTFLEKKRTLYAKYCQGDPSTDKELANSLVQKYRESPTKVGNSWDIILKKTNGENTYTKTALMASRVEKESATKQEFAKKDYELGGGIQSAKICIKYNSNGRCEEEQVLDPGSVIKTAYDKAKSSGFDTAISSFGTGGNGGSFFGDISGVLSLAGQAYDTYNSVSGTINGIQGSINTVTGTVDTITGSGGTGSGNTTPGRPGTNISSVTQVTYTQDLANDPERKASLLRPIQKILNAHLSAITGLATTDANYIAEINNYKASVSDVKTCYEGVLAYADSNQWPYTIPASVFTFYDQETTASDALIQKLTTEKNVSVPNALQIIQNTTASTTDSNSSNEIVAITNRYQDMIDNNNLPTQQTAAMRDSEYQQYKSELQMKMMGDGIGILTVKQAECAAAREVIRQGLSQSFGR